MMCKLDSAWNGTTLTTAPSTSYWAQYFLVVKGDVLMYHWALAENIPESLSSSTPEQG
jgi:hypothetical protein